MKSAVGLHRTGSFCQGPVSILLSVVVTGMLQVAVLEVAVIQAIITPMSPVTLLLVFQVTVLSIIL